MAEGGSKGLFRSLLATLDLGPSVSSLTLDAVLMVALANGDLTLAEHDALELAVADGAFGEVEWREVLARADELAADAPFFTETRQRIEDARWTDAEKADALRVAVRVGTAGTPLADEQRAFFLSLAQNLGVEERDLPPLLPEWGFELAPAEVGLLRPEFADPSLDPPPNLFDALANAQGQTLRALMFKLSGPRDVASRLEGAKISEVGTSITLGEHRLRIDAIIQGDGQEWWVRCLARGEALYPAERASWPSLLSTLTDNQRLVLVHEAPLGPADAALVQGLDAARLRVELI